MDAVEVLHTLMQRIDEHRWDDLESLLHPDFRCRLVHTGEEFDRARWIRLNAEYPGFERLEVQQITGDETTAAVRALVTGRGAAGPEEFACASFALVEAGVIRELTEVWADVREPVPTDRRPSA